MEPPLLMEEHCMARAVFPHEVTDPDFQWLINTYCESHPGAIKLDTSCLPVVIIAGNSQDGDAHNAFHQDEVLALPPGSAEEPETSSPKK
jgi:hypothetical protein